MANSSDPLPSIPTNPNKLHRIYSDSEERNIEKTILYVIFDAENKPCPYLYIDPDGGDVPENRVDCITLAELFKNTEKAKPFSWSTLLFHLPNGNQNGVFHFFRKRTRPLKRPWTI